MSPAASACSRALDIAPGGKVTPHYHLSYNGVLPRPHRPAQRADRRRRPYARARRGGDRAGRRPARLVNAGAERAVAHIELRPRASPASRPRCGSPTGSPPTVACSSTACRATRCTPRWASCAEASNAGAGAKRPVENVRSLSGFASRWSEATRTSDPPDRRSPATPLCRPPYGFEGLGPFAEVLDSHHPSSAEGRDLVVKLPLNLCSASLP
jgi:hypothetical protein